MNPRGVPLHDRFSGCLLGMAIGDALGGRFEGQSAEAIGSRFSSVAALMAYPSDELWYTDDTQMAIGVAQTLVSEGQIREEILCRNFASNYVPSRGYGRGARAVIEAMEEGKDYRAVAAKFFPGGSYGNGAAMRVAPVGLVFHRDPVRLREQARLSALPTHVHPWGIESAELMALAVALVIRDQPFDRRAFFADLLAACQSHEFRQKLEQAERVASPGDLAPLGNGIEALESVPTAIASFALTPESFEQTIGNVILLGGDVDTIACMAGAISGAHLGRNGLPARLVDLLENGPQGRGFLEKLAVELLEEGCHPPDVTSAATPSPALAPPGTG
jgi:poly(ADP-ribose) glycohydrolase ARH3